MSKNMHYTYTHTSTEATTGYFACVPEKELSLEDSFTQLAAAPLDDFLHRHVLRQLLALPVEQVQELWAQERSAQDRSGPAQEILTVLLKECAVFSSAHAAITESIAVPKNYAELTPLPYLSWHAQGEREAHKAWAKVFAANIIQHEKLPHPDEIEDGVEDENLVPLFVGQEPCKIEGTPISELHAALAAKPGPAWSRPPALDTAQRALTLLVENAVLDGVEMRHEASLSPIALLRPWAIDMQVNNGRNAFHLQGQANTYGRGLSVADARASYSMEMIERASAYAGATDTHITGRDGSIPLFKARYSELVAAGHAALDPNTLPLEAPYHDAPLHWVEAREATLDGSDKSQFVPAQCVFLFSNLDEITLMMNPGSTGLASGNSLAEAKVAALTEIIERDAEATMPYDRARCFILRSRDERIAALLEDYAARGIHIHFMDLTTEFGVPCYQAFVLDTKGKVIRATGANLCGAKAALSALTEVPYPYPNGPASGPGIKGLEEKYLEDLPDYSLESSTRHVTLLEQVLLTRGYTPLYVDITTEDLEMPVVRALIPGLELGAELDDYSRISPRLYENYKKIFAE